MNVAAEDGWIYSSASIIRALLFETAVVSSTICGVDRICAAAESAAEREDSAFLDAE